jgi:glycosyltransferase involved in cell wall biosynthesis
MSDSLRILIDARPLMDPAGGGVRRVAQDLLTRVVEQTPDAVFSFVTTGSVRPTLPHPFDTDARVTHIHINLPNKLWSLLAMFGTAALDREATKMLKTRFDGAILPNIGFTGFLTIPYVLVLHDLSFIMEPRWFTPKMRIWHRAVNASDQIRRAAKLFCVSETTARDAERLLGIPRERIETFQIKARSTKHPSLTRSGQAEARGAESDALRASCFVPSPYVLAFGETNPRKNVATAVAAVDRLRQEEAFGNLRLVIVGAPSLSPSPDSDWVIRMNDVSDNDLANLYANASALLYPSWYEGFGLPLHEAARFNIPCLASCHGALPETAPPGVTLLPPAKPHLWASALRDVLRYPGSYRTSPTPETEDTDVTPFLRWLQSIRDSKNLAQQS